MLLLLALVFSRGLLIEAYAAEASGRALSASVVASSSTLSAATAGCTLGARGAAAVALLLLRLLEALAEEGLQLRESPSSVRRATVPESFCGLYVGCSLVELVKLGVRGGTADESTGVVRWSEI